jgi:hypothetical protein
MAGKFQNTIQNLESFLSLLDINNRNHGSPIPSPPK